MKVIIIGAVAGGASAATRLRRLDEKAEIILLERGDYVSYANCGLPYYIGGKITQKSALTVQTPESLRTRFNLDVRTRNNAVAIHTEKKLVEIQELDTGRIYSESYDYLILSPGAEPIKPPFKGADDPRVFTLRNIPDTYKISDFIDERRPKKAMIVGAGYIGLEMAENLVQAGLKVTVVELSDHVIGPLDADMAADVHYFLKQNNINLLLNNGVKAINSSEKGLIVSLSEGNIETDMVLLSIGVSPDSALARNAGLSIGSNGAIIVDEHMRTSDENIFAVGDAVQIMNFVTDQAGYIPLAGPANKQGRIAADNIAGLSTRYNGTQGTAVLKLFNMTIGATGLNEATADRLGLDYDKVYLLTNSHATYYPGAKSISMKLLFENVTGRILGAQLVGFEGVDKRLDVLSVAIRAGMTADDLTELELGYAPPFSSAKDPVNMVGFMIQNIINGLVRQYHWQQVAALIEEGANIIDIRSPIEYSSGHIENASNIPLDELRGRLDEIDRGKPVYIYCHSGARSYTASRILAKNGFSVSHLAGGYRLYSMNIENSKSPLDCRDCK